MSFVEKRESEFFTAPFIDLSGFSPVLFTWSLSLEDIFCVGQLINVKLFFYDTLLPEPC